MRDYQKELADSLDKSDQIAKLEAKVEKLQRQLELQIKESQRLMSILQEDDPEFAAKYVELQRQLAEVEHRYYSLLESSSSDIAQDIITRNEMLYKKLAERDALIKRLQNAIREAFKAYNRIVGERYESKS